MTKKSKTIPPEKKASKEESLWELIKTVLYALVLALVVRSFAYEPFSIPSGSMIPSLLVNDYLFVRKFSYGYSRYSFPLGLPPFKGRIWASAPKRGDIVVFKLPTDNKTDYIKRVMGLPGDRMQVRHGVVFINGQQVQRRKIHDFEVRVRGRVLASYPQYEETLPSGVKYTVLDGMEDGPLDNTGEYIVPEGHYFMMGDNRDNSIDSRVLERVGYVPFENLVGRASFIFFSVEGPFWAFWQWGENLRGNRFFKDVRR